MTNEDYKDENGEWINKCSTCCFQFPSCNSEPIFLSDKIDNILQEESDKVIQCDGYLKDGE